MSSQSIALYIQHPKIHTLVNIYATIVLFCSMKKSSYLDNIRLHHIMQIVRTQEWSWTMDRIQRIFQELANNGVFTVDTYVHHDHIAIVHFLNTPEKSIDGLLRLLNYLHTEESLMQSYILVNNSKSISAYISKNGAQQKIAAQHDLPLSERDTTLKHIGSIWKKDLDIDLVF